MHYQGCISLAQLFGDIIADIRAITLSAIQQAWFRFEGSKRVLINLRVMLVRLLEAQITQGGTDAASTIQEYARVASWVQMINLRIENSDKVYLSEAEFDTLLDGCLEDIKQGLSYTQRSGSTVGQKTSDIHAEDAVAVLHWGIALKKAFAMLEQWEQENLELRRHIRLLTRRLEQAGGYVDLEAVPQGNRMGHLRPVDEDS